MSQKIAFITGGNRGLGFQTALDLKDTGAKIVIGSRDLAQGEEAVAKLRAAGVDADLLQFRHYKGWPMRRPPSTTSTRSMAGSTFWSTTPESPAARSPASGRTHSLRGSAGSAAQGLRDQLLCAGGADRGAAAAAQEEPCGTHRQPLQHPGFAHPPSRPAIAHLPRQSFAYDASKTALNAFTVHLAYELRDTKIKVNSAHPGWVKTDMGGPEAPMELSEGAKTSAALATLPDDGPSGGYFHLGQPLPW